MATFLSIKEEITDTRTGKLLENELVRVIGEEVYYPAKGRASVRIVKKATLEGIRTTIHVTFYDSDNYGILAAVHGSVERADLHLHGDFSRDLANVTMNGGMLSVSAD
jgi:hypothetical protein